MKTIAVLLVLSATAAHAANPASWTRPVAPVRIAGNLYYVGTEELAAYLLVGKEGDILLDAPMEENAALVLHNIEKLGQDPKRVRILLNSHAHFDHAGGFARIKAATGAKLYLSAPDAELAARGGRNDFAFDDKVPYTPVHADVIVQDGQTIHLGELAMTPLLTPGHTKGCTTWRTTVMEHGKPLEVLFGCSLTFPGYQLVDNPKYPTILADYHHSFDRLRPLHPDIFLANHGGFFTLTRKLAALHAGGANPFIDRAEFPAYLDRAEKALEAEVAKERWRMK